MVFPGKVFFVKLKKLRLVGKTITVTFRGPSTITIYTFSKSAKTWLSKYVSTVQRFAPGGNVSSVKHSKVNRIYDVSPVKQSTQNKKGQVLNVSPVKHQTLN